MPFWFRMIKSKIGIKMRKSRLLGYIFFYSLIILCIYLVYIYYGSFRPALYTLAESRISVIATRVTNEAINEVMLEKDMSYDKLITFMKNDDNQVTALMSNIITINKLKSEIVVRITEKMSNVKRTPIYIPFGNLTGLDFLSGVGPNLIINLVPASSTEINFVNNFTAAGINQTKHEIILEAKTTIAALIPNSPAAQTEVITQIPIAETVIVGVVPEIYANLDSGANNLIKDIVKKE